MTTKLTMGRAEWLLLVLLSILWGGSFFFAKIALVAIAPLTLVLLRVAIASLALGLIIKASGQSLPASRRLWAMFFVMGLCNNLVPFSLLFFGQIHIGAGLASIFNSLVPVFTVVIAHMFTGDEKLSAGKLSGVALGTIGVSVMIGIDLSNGIDAITMMAMLACVAAALSYGIASVYGRRFARVSTPPLCVAFGQVSASAVMMLPLVIVFDQPWNASRPSAAVVLAVLALALLSTALAYIIFFRILERGGATNISLVTLLIPVSAIALGWLFLDERLALNHVAGMALILSGLIALDGRVPRMLRQRFRRRKLPAECCASSTSC